MGDGAREGRGIGQVELDVVEVGATVCRGELDGATRHSHQGVGVARYLRSTEKQHQKIRVDLQQCTCSVILLRGTTVNSVQNVVRKNWRNIWVFVYTVGPIYYVCIAPRSTVVHNYFICCKQVEMHMPL